jgi:hypothetical protein
LTEDYGADSTPIRHMSIAVYTPNTAACASSFPTILHSPNATKDCDMPSNHNFHIGQIVTLSNGETSRVKEFLNARGGVVSVEVGKYEVRRWFRDHPPYIYMGDDTNYNTVEIVVENNLYLTACNEGL